MEVRDYIVNVGPQGTFKPSGSYSSTPTDIDSMFETFEKENVNRITIYFHGGLVNEKTGMETAIKMGNHFNEINQRPICFVWETGLMESVSSNIGKISESKLFSKLIKILTKLLASKLGFDIAEGRGEGVSLRDDQIDEELNRRTPFLSYTQSNLALKGRGFDATTNLPSSPEELEGEIKYIIEAIDDIDSLLQESEFTIPDQKGGHSRGIVDTAILIKSVAKIAFRVIKRFSINRDHNFYPTIIEELLRELYIAELGAWVWNNMKVKSDDMWKSNSGVSGINQYAGRYLFDKLVTYHKQHPGIQVNLVGHSAGSIAICNMLKMSSASYPELIFNNIIFMAPACRIDLFRDEIVLHPNRFVNFRMFTMTDDNEKNDSLVPYFYTHSLLYLISGILEDKGNDFDAYILGLERHIKAASPYHKVQVINDAHLFIYANGVNRVAFSQTSVNAFPGLRTRSLSHGDFDDDAETIASIKHILL